MARALADYLETRGVLDVVPSDIAAGFLVLQRLQKLRVHRARQEIVQTLSQSLTMSTTTKTNESNWMATTAMEHGNIIFDDQKQEQQDVISFGSSSSPPPPRQQQQQQYSSPVHTRNGLDSQNMSQQQQTTTEERMHGRCPSSSRDDESLLLPLGGFNTQHDTRKSVYYCFNDDGTYERETRKILSRDSLNDMNLLNEGARYAKYALAIYTWVLYLYVHPVTGIPRLATKGCLACLRRKKKEQPSSSSSGDDGLFPDLVSEMLDENGRFDGDNMCESHKTALLLTAGLEEADLVYVQLKSGFHHNPYCILLDHEWKSVVVSIRGTFSLEDCVMDVLIEPEPLEQIGQDFGFDAENQYCHGGVLLWVRNIYRDLQRHQILEKLLLADDAKYSGYSLRLVGHSLGAAACTILSYMLRSKFPLLRCVNYSPPGCSLTMELAIGCREWCSSFVLDSDIVPRLSYDSMAAWRDEILELIGRIKVPKVEVLQRLLGQEHVKGGCNCEGLFDPPLDDPDSVIDDIKDILYEPHEVPETEYQRQLERFKVIHEERRRSRGERRAVKLFPPGNMVHLVKTGERRECVHGLVKCLTCFTTNYGFYYTPVFINNNDLNEIVISPHMGTDHFPNRMLNVMSAVAKEYGLDS